MFGFRSLKATLVGMLALSALTGCGHLAPSNAGDSLSLASRSDSAASVTSENGMTQVVLKRRSLVRPFNAAAYGLSSVSTIGGLGVQVAYLPTSKLNATLKRLRADNALLYADPALPMKALGLPSAPVSLLDRAIQVNDPLYSEQYAPQLTRAPEAWARSTGRGVTVAIVDTGIDTAHPDLQANVVPGYNALRRNTNAKDDNGHGTHCAGVTAAQAGNREGIAGIAPDAKLMPIKVLSANGGGSDAGVADGIVWAVDHGAHVVSMSLGGPGESKVLRDAVNYALSRNVVVVAAMGNDGTNELSYPAAYPGVIAVGASDASDKIAEFSQWGSWISVAAPGVQIMSTLPTYKVDLNNYGYPMRYAAMDGTSMATPAVAGLAALLKSVQPAATPAQVKARIEQSSDKVAGENTFTPHFGHGRINAGAALR